MVAGVQEMLKIAVAAAQEKKALDIISLDMRKISLFTDFFLICSGRSKIQTQAIADEIMEKMQSNKIQLLHKEGYEEGKWILLDYNYVVLHIFQPDVREFYNLERLWGDAPKVAY